MTITERVALAVLIVVLDVAVFVVPVTGLLAAWVLLARPSWFRQWVDRLYDGDRPPLEPDRLARQQRAGAAGSAAGSGSRRRARGPLSIRPIQV